ncbi:hypothetical protein MPH_14102, partial [Macrophomina phaseolina MS6]
MAESSTGKELGSIPRLISSKNFIQWKTLMEAYFRREDLWRIVSGQLAKPPEQETLDPDKEDAMKEDEFKKYERKLKRYNDWTTKDAKAVYAIKMT